MTDLIDGVPYFGHDGGVWGVNAVFRMTPEDDVVVVLSNVSPGGAQRAAMRAADQLARLPESAAGGRGRLLRDNVGFGRLRPVLLRHQHRDRRDDMRDRDGDLDPNLRDERGRRDRLKDPPRAASPGVKASSSPIFSTCADAGAP